MIAALLTLLGCLTVGMVMDAFSASEESADHEDASADDDILRSEGDLLAEELAAPVASDPIPSTPPLITDFTAGEDVLVVMPEDNEEVEAQELELRQTAALTELWLNGTPVAAVPAEAGLTREDVLIGRGG